VGATSRENRKLVFDWCGGGCMGIIGPGKKVDTYLPPMDQLEKVEFAEAFASAVPNKIGVGGCFGRNPAHPRRLEMELGALYGHLLRRAGSRTVEDRPFTKPKVGTQNRLSDTEDSGRVGPELVSDVLEAKGKLGSA
jgi:hypothetical protein